MCTARALHAHCVCYCHAGAPYYMAGLLDQGYWPDGLYTAPSDEALASDIAAAKALGFNLLRKHAKATACCVPLLYLPVHQPCAAQLPPMCCSMTTPLPPDDRPLTTLHRLTAPPPPQVEPARWYYHADRLGMLVWQDMPSPPALTCKSAADGDPMWVHDLRAKEPSDNGDKDENPRP
jgi:hypothetical protein